MIIIVGAGPAGLAMAYELQQRNLSYRILERCRIGFAWQNHYDRLHLHTLKQVSALPGLPMPDDYPPFPSAAQFQRYLAQYARHFQLDVASGVEVQSATWNARAWQIMTNQGLVEGDTLVVATGIWSTPYVPALGGEAEFGGSIMHSRDYRNPTPFVGKRTLVVGVGNSGAEIAVDLSENGVATGISIQSGAAFVPHPRSAMAMRALSWLFRRMPRSLSERVLRRVRRDYSAIGIPWPPGMLLDAYPVVGYQLPEAVAAGRVTRSPGVSRFLPGRVQFDNGSSEPFDAVVMATGYRPTIHFVADQVDLDQHGKPRVDRYWRSVRNPHLVCVGFAYPTTEGWLQAIGRVARTAAEGIAQGRR
jgi:putative flavoprotein involved in K+ transport